MGGKVEFSKLYLKKTVSAWFGIRLTTQDSMLHYMVNAEDAVVRISGSKGKIKVTEMYINKRAMIGDLRKALP